MDIRKQRSMEYDIQIIRSRRRTLQIEIRQDCSIIVRAPYRVSRAEIDRFINERSSWIEKNLQKMQGRIRSMNIRDALTENEIKALTELARAYIPPRVAEYAAVMGIKYGRVTIRCQKSRWGSCSSKGNLNFNCLLMKVPPEIRDYVIVHELCHIPHPDHSRAFWAEVAIYCPDYKELRNRLRESGDLLFLRLE